MEKLMSFSSLTGAGSRESLYPEHPSSSSAPSTPGREEGATLGLLIKPTPALLNRPELGSAGSSAVNNVKLHPPAAFLPKHGYSKGVSHQSFSPVLQHFSPRRGKSLAQGPRAEP